MLIFIAASVPVLLGTAAYFILLMADGRRLEERLAERRSRPVPRETGPEAPLAPSERALWTAAPFAGPGAPRPATPRSLYPTTPGSAGLG